MTWNKEIDGGVRNADYPGYTLREIDGKWRLKGPHPALPDEGVAYRNLAVAMLAAETVAEEGKVPPGEPEPQNWIVIGQENHPDRFNVQAHGPYTYDLAVAEADRRNTAVINYVHGHKLYNWHVMELGG